MGAVGSWAQYQWWDRPDGGGGGPGPSGDTSFPFTRFPASRLIHVLVR